MPDPLPDAKPEPVSLSLTQHLMNAYAAIERAHGTVDAFEDRMFEAKPRPSTGALTAPPPAHLLAQKVQENADKLGERLAALTDKL